jgi:hypothetical protein
MLVAALALVPTGVAQAQPPDHSVEHVDDTFTDTTTCSFPIAVHVQGTVRHTNFFDQNGNVVRSLTVFPGFKVTFSANGTSITTASPIMQTDTLNADGSVTVALSGLLNAVTVPGQGVVAIVTGHTVLIAFTDGTLQVVFQAGPATFDLFDAVPPQLCDVLAGP